MSARNRGSLAPVFHCKAGFLSLSQLRLRLTLLPPAGTKPGGPPTAKLSPILARSRVPPDIGSELPVGHCLFRRLTAGFRSLTRELDSDSLTPLY